VLITSGLKPARLTQFRIITSQTIENLTSNTRSLYSRQHALPHPAPHPHLFQGRKRRGYEKEGKGNDGQGGVKKNEELEEEWMDWKGSRVKGKGEERKEKDGRNNK